MILLPSLDHDQTSYLKQWGIALCLNRIQNGWASYAGRWAREVEVRLEVVGAGGKNGRWAGMGGRWVGDGWEMGPQPR